ncbi:hypothetical protein [Nocardioides sp. MH1]|uniref:hypothetical protein n=1 Tax=Nocardioides sp. MH1 TaxID=3242490 RepID=UPI00352006A9
MIGRRRWWLLAPFLVVAGYALLANRDWVGGWAGAVDRTTGSTVLTGPVLASIAAGLQLGVTRLRPISETTVRGHAVPYRSAAQAAAIGVVGYGATLAGAVAVTLSVPHGGPAQWWTGFAGVLVLVLAALFGALCAHLLPSPLTVVAAGPTLFLIGAFGPAPLPEALRFGPTGSLVGLQVVASVYLTRFALVVALCVCLGVAMAPWRVYPRRIRLLTAAGAAGVVTAGAAVGVFAAGTGIGDTRLERSAEGPTACAGTAPTVCVAPSERRLLAGVQRAIGRGAEVLRSAGVDLPARYVQQLPYAEAPAGSGEFYLDDREDRSATESVLMLTHPASCPQWSQDTPPFAALDAQQVIAEWAAARHGERPTAFSPEMEKWLPHLDDAATTSWVVRTFDQLRSCDLDRIVLPWDLD